MPQKYRDSLTIFRFPALSRYPILKHGVYSRRGGISAIPFKSLNISYNVGDQIHNVQSNLRIIQRTFAAQQLFFMNQSHGSTVISLSNNTKIHYRNIPQADAAITNMRRIALLISLADCQGAIIFDPHQKVVANVHCGWRGNVKNILGKVVKQMKLDFNCQPHQLLAAISPSLGPCCGEFKGYQEIFPKAFEAFSTKKKFFDLWAISRWQLEMAGLKKENINIAGICTRCNPDLFFSFRGEGRTGRFGIVAMLT